MSRIRTLTLSAVAGLLIALTCSPARAANTCNGFLAIDYPSAQTFSNVGDTLQVTLTLGAGSINGGTKATVNRVRFELDCDAGSPLGLGCQDDGGIISYLGDQTITTDCPRTFSTGHAAGTAPNEIVFTPATPFDIPASTPTFCSITFGVAVAALSDDVTPGEAEEIAGYSAVSEDLKCDNGLPSSGSQSGAIDLCPSCNDNNGCTQDSCNPATGACINIDTVDATCGDNNACTQDSCNPATGLCINTDTVTATCGDNNACTQDSCNPATGGCVNTDTVTPTCNDNNACTQDVCDPDTGLCSNPGTCNDNTENFECYRTQPSRAVARVVDLVDQFGAMRARVGRLSRLCNPADSGSDPDAPGRAEHLTRYAIRRIGAPTEVRRRVQVTNRFGTVALDVDLRRPQGLLVPASKSLTPPPPALLPAGAIDHFTCYTVSRSPGTRFERTPIDLRDELGMQSFTVIRPHELCAPADKNGESPGAETHAEHLLCYNILLRGPRLTRATVFATDQFLSGPVDLRTQKQQLCVSSTKD